MSLCWSGEIRVLRRHGGGNDDEQCPGAGRPAVGELSSVPRAVDARVARDRSPGPTGGTPTTGTPTDEQPSDPSRRTGEQHVAEVA